MTSGASHCVLFSKEQRHPRFSFISTQWEKSSLSQCVCLLKHKGCLFFKQACSPAYICTDSPSYRHNRKLRISPTAECKMEACLPATLENQHWGHLIYTREGDTKASHNRRHQHVWRCCVPAATKHKNTTVNIVSRHRGVGKINNQHGWQHSSDQTHAPPCWRNGSTLMWSAVLTACKWDLIHMQNFQHPQHFFSDDLTSSFLTCLDISFELQSTGLLNHRKQTNTPGSVVTEQLCWSS